MKSTVTNFAKSVASKARKSAQAFATRAVAAIKRPLNAVTRKVSSAISKIKKFPAQINKVVAGVASAARRISQFPGKIASAVRGAINTAKSFAQRAVNAAVNAIKIPLDKVIGAVKTVVTEVGKIPSKISTFVTNAVSAVKATFNSIIEGVKSWLKKIGDAVEGFTKFVTQLYDKYLKPIISFVGDCAGNAKSAPEFMLCAIQPMIDKVLGVLSPNGETVPSKLTFPRIRNIPITTTRPVSANCINPASIARTMTQGTANSLSVRSILILFLE